MPLNIELFSRETTCLHATVISTVTSLPAPLAIKGSAGNRRMADRSVTDHAKNRPILITGRSIGASLIIIIDLIDLSKFLPELLRLWFMKSCFRH